MRRRLAVAAAHLGAASPAPDAAIAPAQPCPCGAAEHWRLTPQQHAFCEPPPRGLRPSPQRYARIHPAVAAVDTFGYLHLRGLFKPQLTEITTAFEEVWARHGQRHGGDLQGREHDGTQRSVIFPFIDQHERLCALLDDPKLLGVAGSLLGDDFNYWNSDGNLYASDTSWHSDGWERNHTTGRGLLTIKLAFYLDSLTAESGSLRVLPGSHRHNDAYAERLEAALGEGYRGTAAPLAGSDPRAQGSVGAWGVDGAAMPAVAIESEPGDLVVFNHDLK